MAYTDDAVKAKLSALNESQESIVTVAQWVMFHRYGKFYRSNTFHSNLLFLTIAFAGDTQIVPLHYGFSDSRILALTNDSIWSTSQTKLPSNQRLEERMTSLSLSHPLLPKLQPSRTKEPQMKCSRNCDDQSKYGDNG